MVPLLSKLRSDVEIAVRAGDGTFESFGMF
jgi:hypothetical protein